MRSASTRAALVLSHSRPVLAVALLTGCASVGSAFSRGAIATGLETLNEPQSRATAKEILTSPEIREGTRQLAMSATDGLITEVGNRLEAQGTWDNVAGTLSSSIDREVTPRVQAWTAAAVRSALDEATNEESRAALRRLSASLTRSVSSEVARGIREELSPALREALQGDLHDAIVGSSRDIAQAVAQSMKQSIAEQQPSAPETFSTRANRLLTRLLRITWVGALLLLLFCGWLLYRLVRSGPRQTVQPATAPVTVTPELLKPLVAQALHELLSDPASAQAFAREMHQSETPPPH